MLGMAFLNATLIPLLCRKAGESSSARPYASIVFGAEAQVALHLEPSSCPVARQHCRVIPETDARGKLTSHRARSTIASMLGNAKEPMTLLELQQWLGHRWPSSTQH
jgi:hypothetical protein